MCAVIRGKRRLRAVGASAAVACVVFGVCIIFSLSLYIDRKLNESAQNQAVAFTEQAAAGVSDRIGMVQNAIGAFTVQSSDPADYVPALDALRERNGFAHVAAVGMDGEGFFDGGEPFSTRSLVQEETALSSQAQSYSGTFENEDGVRVRLAQKPLFVGEKQVGALYVQVPLDLFTMPADLDMFDGRGYFMLFEAQTGEILVTPEDGTRTPVLPSMTIFDFLGAATRYESSTAPGLPGEGLLALQAQQEAGIGNLVGNVESGTTGLIVSVIDGKSCYVCVAPVNDGMWYVCSVVPMQNVRAEASVVTATFEIMFFVMTGCLAAVAYLAFSSYRRHLRGRHVSMMSQLYDALSDSVDMAVNLYSPADRAVTPIAAKSADIIGYPLKDFLHDPTLCDAIGISSEGAVVFERIRTGEVASFEQGEFSFRDPRTGCERWAAYSVKPLEFDGKRQLLVVLRDVTPDKEIQLSMKEAMDAAEAANQAKSEFLSRMSHEVRTPMNVIIGMLQIAQGSLDDVGKTRESLSKIGAASDHLLGLINDVLDISKIENGKMTFSSEPFRLKSVLAHVVAVARAQCDQKGHDFSVVLSDHVSGILMGDPVRLKQLLVNLLANAAKYTPEGGHIRFETSVDPGSVMGYRQVTFIVADDGIGMSEEFKQHLFEPFTMEGRSREQGTGLGMSIVRNIVTMLGGSMTVESELDRGTTFEVTLNLRIALEAERKAFEEAEAEEDRVLRGRGTGDGAGAGSSPRAFGAEVCAPAQTSLPVVARVSIAPALDRSELKGLRVLLAEDNDLNAEIACELLSESGLVIDRAADGAEACALFESSAEGTYDAVLMDVQMPLLNGYEATRRIRAFDRADASRVPIIAMSANAFADDVRASLESGMNAHLSKPIDMRHVLSTIIRFVRKRRADERDAAGEGRIPLCDGFEDGSCATAGTADAPHIAGKATARVPLDVSAPDETAPGLE